MPSASTNDKSEGRAKASSTKAVVGDVGSSKGGLADTAGVAPVQAGKHASTTPASSPAYTTDSSSILPPDEMYSKEETMLRQYSRDIYAYTLTLYNSQRIDSAHRGRAAALKRAISDIAIPMKAMAVGDSARI